MLGHGGYSGVGDLFQGLSAGWFPGYHQRLTHVTIHCVHSMFSFPSVRLLSSLGGSVVSLWTLLAAGVLLTFPAVTPVGPVVAIVLSSTILSLPLWAVGLLYSFYRRPLGVSNRFRDVLIGVAGGTVALYVVGFGAVLSQTQPFRTVGDWLYVAATIMLLVLSVGTLLIEHTDSSYSG